MSVEPKSFGKTDADDVDSVTTFSTLIDSNRVKYDPKTRDKFPNTDGNVILVDKKGIPEGVFEVQIKKISGYFNPTRPRMKIPLSLYAYSKRTANPTFFVGVDLLNHKAYWLYIDDDVKDVRGTAFKDCDYETVSVPLKHDNAYDGIIDGVNCDYFKRWKEITDLHLEKVHKITDLHTEYAELAKRAHPSLGVTDKNFRYIHTFLDELNNLLEKLYVIKARYYPDTWKLGFLYAEFSEISAVFTLFPIAWETNDIQIKKIENWAEAEKRGLGFTFHNGNSIISNPKSYASNWVKSKIERIMKENLLLINNEFLATEFTFSFIDKFYEQLNLEKKDKYSSDELISALDTYNTEQGHIHGFQSVLFQESVNYLNINGINNVERIYASKDYSKTVENSLIWNTLTPDELKNNLKIFFENLPSVYVDTLNANFPKISKELNELNTSSRLVVNAYGIKDSYSDINDAPRISCYYLKNRDKEFKIDLHFADEKDKMPLQDVDFLQPWLEGVKVDGIQYKLVQHSFTILDFMYNDTPMFYYIHDDLKSRIKKYLDSNAES